MVSTSSIPTSLIKVVAYLAGAIGVAMGLWYALSSQVIPIQPVKDTTIATFDSGPILPIPLNVNAVQHYDPMKAMLGERLFHEKRLSHDDSVSCSSCHDLNRGGADRLPFSVGSGGQKNAINTPTVFNSVFNFRQFWNGRARTLEDQLTDSINNPKQMGSTWGEVLSKLSADFYYAEQFSRLYGGLSADAVKDAMTTYLRTLVTPNSRFDRFLRGDRTILSADEKEGYRLFKDYGCASCHQGMNVGGNMFQKFGVMGDYFSERGNPIEADMGRYAVTKDAADMHVFKVPSLRNIALTAPYFHDGSAPTLYATVKTMGKYQLGIDLPEKDILSIVIFLNTLTGEYQGKPL